jgi:hypothetical protein
MNRFLSNINKIPIVVKHVSGKYDLNTLSDHQSRHPSECSSDTCSVHKLITDLSETVLDPADKCAPIRLNLKDNPNVILRDPRTNPGGSYMSVRQVSVPAPPSEGDISRRHPP